MGGGGRGAGERFQHRCSTKSNGCWSKMLRFPVDRGRPPVTGFYWNFWINNAWALMPTKRLNRCTAIFNWVSKVISELVWFYITSLSDWFNVLKPFSQPIRTETKTNRGSRMHIFPHWFTGLSPAFLIGQRNYLIGFNFTTIDCNLL